MHRRIVQGCFILFIVNSCGEILPEPHALKYQDKEFNAIANFILDQNDIYQMDDFSRHYKRINGISVKLKANEGDQDAQFLEVAVDSLELDNNIVSSLRTQLAETKLREFIRSGDTILFTVDGFLDDAWGFMYSRTGLTMDSAQFRFKGNTVAFVEDINKNWKRTAIH